ncbi:hypothetical protein F4810DRAFT_318459 [Camillea tinctor]|nr:hypothetical protein F4810DRAFT_318459 [Camillea tinctor]
MASSSAVQLLQSSASSASHHPRASTAPVLEFVCLFTHDLRRKQKRWQDGRLKYHTFNKRVMVYDERGNFIGDTHWCEDYGFGEGEELQLERGSSIVQVAECVGSRDQDLSELVDKRAQEKVRRQSAALARRAPAVESSTPQAATPHFQLQQKPLHSLIGTPTGHHGRAAMPTESPYEERQKQVASPLDDNARPAKRRKRDPSPPSKSGYAQSLFGATLTLSGRPMSSAPIRHQPSKALPVREDNLNPASSDPSHQDSDLDSGQTATKPHLAPKSRRPGLLNVQPGSSLLKIKPSRPASPPAQSIAIDATGLSSSPPGHKIDDVQRSPSRSTISHTKKSGSKKVEKAKSLKTQNPLRSASINRNLCNPRGSGDTLLKVNAEHVSDDSISIKHPVEGVEDGQPRTSRPKMASRKRNHLSIVAAPDASKIVDLTSEKEPLLTEPPSVNEPRTELRIKPRKKRGLLMMSEKGAVDNSISMHNKPKTRKHRDPPIKSFERLSVDSVGETGSMEEGPLAGKSSDDAAQPTQDNTRLVGDGPYDPTDVDKPQRETQGRDTIAIQKLRRKSRREANPSGSSEEMTAGKQNRASSVKSYTQNKDKTGSSYMDQGHHDPSPFDDDSSEERMPRGRRNKTREQTVIQSLEHQSDDQANEDSPPRKRRSLRRKNTPSEVVEEYDEPESPPPPRLAHLGRRNIRSKEVIGFIFDDDDVKPISRSNSESIDQASEVCVHPDKSAIEILPATSKNATIETPEATDSRVQDQITDSENESLTTKPRCEQGGDPQYPSVPPAPLAKIPLQRQDSTMSNPSTMGVDKPTVSLAQSTVAKPQNVPIPKLINPATRGKKAAKPSDAAGQMPICPLPSEVGPHMTSNPEQPPNPRKRPGLANGKAASAAMPGFARANGGPWSREAHDLFEFRRPS